VGAVRVVNEKEGWWWEREEFALLLSSFDIGLRIPMLMAGSEQGGGGWTE